MAVVLSPAQLRMIETVERTVSVFSVAGALFIIISFLTTKQFHRPINRLVFFAAWGNLCSNVATLIAQAGPAAGNHSSICKVQGLFIQTFLPADVLFCAAMAINVYMTVCHSTPAKRLRKWEPYYLLGAYGTPLLSGLIYLFIDLRPGFQSEPIYGDAVLWCWVSQEHGILRVVVFYIPVWVIIVFTFILYIRAGRVIMELRRNLRAFHKSHRHRNTSKEDLSGSFARARTASPIPLGAIHLSTQVVNVVTPAPAMLASAHAHEDIKPMAHYEVAISGGEGEHDCDRDCHCSYDDEETQIDTPKIMVPIGRLSSSNFSPVQIPINTQAANAAISRSKATMKANAAAWAYARCALLFFIGLVITWIPSSVNRVYGYVHPNSIHYGLQLASACVLPAQGLWNAIIYVATSWTATKRTWTNIFRIFEASKFSANKPQALPDSGSFWRTSRSSSDTSSDQKLKEVYPRTDIS